MSDGLVVVAVGNPRLWAQFCAAIDAPELEHDARFAGNTDRMQHRDELLQELNQRIGAWPRRRLIERLQAHTVPCGEVRSLAEAMAEPQLTARDMVVDIPHPTLSHVRALGNPIKLSRTPATTTGPPPALGEHTTEVLEALRRSSESGPDHRRRS